MKLRKIISCVLGTTLLLGTPSCTDLSETVYDQIMSTNYYQTKDDVTRAFVRPFEHAYWSITATYRLQEITADQIGTWERDGWFYDGGIWDRLHKHTWGLEGTDAWNITNAWNGLFQGIGQCNVALEDFDRIQPEQYGYTAQEFEQLKAQLHTLRAWFYIRALDLFRYVPKAVSFADQSFNTTTQLDPKETFTFIEGELLAALHTLSTKEGMGGNGMKQGQWNKASAAALLVRLYLNAEKWIGEPKYTECATYAQQILDGTYGTYVLANQWSEPFDWNNETCNELLFGFTASASRTHWHMDSSMYWWCAANDANRYFGFTDWGTMLPSYAVQPSLDVDGNPYNFELGTPVARFKKYAEDVRLKKYRNLSGESRREGMFLYGYLTYNNDKDSVKSPTTPYVLYLRDQVGRFYGTKPGVPIADKESNVLHGDMNSGWSAVKYPIYRDNDPGAMEADYAEIRLAEIYYSLAECKFRASDVEGAAKLLNSVRRRNYPETSWAEYLYQPEGRAVLTAGELLDEWGREFFNEGRRRTDLCRWNKYSSATWWDKKPEADNHTDIFILTKEILGANPDLKQNPGYPDIAR